MINGAAYIRVSTEDQTEFSPDAQLKAIKEYAKRNNIILTKDYIFIDEGISGKRADKRPAFQLMIATAKQKSKLFEVILVHKFDRFARSREDSVVYKSLLKKEAGVRVISISEHMENDKFSIILEAMLEAMAEYYSLNLAEEVKKGMTEKAERGEYQTTAPFGYKIENKKLIVIPDEAEIVRFIFNKFAAREMGMRALAAYINDLGVKSKRGNSFENRSVDYILNNPVYIGKTRWTPTTRIRRNFNHPDSIVKDGKHEAVISTELWDKAQAVIKENKEIFPYHNKSNSKKITWLHGLVRCGACGKTMVRNRDTYLQCNAYSKGQCKTSSSIRIDVLEKIVLEEIKKTFTAPLNIKIVPKTSDTERKYEFDLLNKQLKNLEVKYERIKTAYRDGIDTIDEYSENKIIIENERTRLIQSLTDLKDMLLNTDVEQPLEERLEDAYTLLTNETIDFDIKYNAAHFLIDNITYEKEAKTLKLVYKY
jgi:DNA invertase Pin-like site-specific DNA recombinase